MADTDISTSPRYKLNAADLRKIGTGALIAAGGAALTYLAPLVAQIDYTVVFWGAEYDLTPFAVAFFAIIINLARKWLANHER